MHAPTTWLRRELNCSFHKLHVLEAFNGQYFFNLPDEKSQTDSANRGLSIASSSVDGVPPTLYVSVFEG
ncbi:MAG: hypothetical protein PHH11_06060, partial [Methylomonas sp.]|nr:hypothetical protein [Methylomonas sp.]